MTKRELHLLNLKMGFNDIAMREWGLDITDDDYIYDMDTETIIQINEKFIKYSDLVDPILKFNENIESTLQETVSEDGKTITYTSTGDGYDNATYTLTVRIETVQYDQASNLWK